MASNHEIKEENMVIIPVEFDNIHISALYIYVFQFMTKAIRKIRRKLKK